MSDPKKPETDEPVDRARRRLLARAVYVPPVVIGIISLQQAGCQQTPSCQPNNCAPTTNPCQPSVNPCSPNTGCNPDNCNPQNCNPRN